jgi:protein-disulfide isomerase
VAKPRSHPRRRPAITPLAIAALLAGNAAAADDPAPRSSLLSTEEANELELLRSMARQTRAPVKSEDIVIRVDGHPTIGRPEATVVLIEFSDLQCGFCRRHVVSTLPVLLERYVDTGRMRYVFFDFPVEAQHPEAYGAAIAARCAADQNVVQPLRQRLLTSPNRLQPEQLTEHAAALGLNTAAFSRCLSDGTKAEAVQLDLTLGQQLMIRGTPTFLVGLSQGNNAEVRVLRRIVGAQPLDVFETAIAGIIAEAQSSVARLPSFARPD